MTAEKEDQLDQTEHDTLAPLEPEALRKRKQFELAFTMVEDQWNSFVADERFVQPPETSEKYTALVDVLAQHGVNEQTARELITSWCSYNPFGFIKEEDEGRTRASDNEQTETLLRRFGVRNEERLQKQMDAALIYIEKYGSDELDEVHNIFGTCNFIRCSADFIHNQLLERGSQLGGGRI